MSRGRHGFRLEDLQSVARQGGKVEVARRLLGGEAPVRVPRPDLSGFPEDFRPTGVKVVVGVREVREPEPVYDLPADWPYETTPEDVEREVLALVMERVPWGMRHSVRAVVAGKAGDLVPPKTVDHIMAEWRRAAREVMKTLVLSPGRKKQTKRMPVRSAGESSDVVVRTRTGFLYSEHGVPLDEEQVAEVLTVADPYRYVPYEEERRRCR